MRMSIQKRKELMSIKIDTAACDYCDEPAVIELRGYSGPDKPHVHWCKDCALQVVRKISEDLCELLTKGGRQGLR
jgi:hypothetical protein